MSLRELKVSGGLLKKQIRQLEQALGRTQADKVLNEAFLELACEELGQDVEAFKKKSISRSPLVQKKDPEKA